MPPAEKPRPSVKDIEALVGWISHRTAAAEAARSAAVLLLLELESRAGLVSLT
jgi:hypothetical protein